MFRVTSGGLPESSLRRAGFHLDLQIPQGCCFDRQCHNFLAGKLLCQFIKILVFGTAASDVQVFRRFTGGFFQFPYGLAIAVCQGAVNADCGQIEGFWKKAGE